MATVRASNADANKLSKGSKAVEEFTSVGWKGVWTFEDNLKYMVQDSFKSATVRCSRYVDLYCYIQLSLLIGCWWADQAVPLRWQRMEILL